MKRGRGSYTIQKVVESKKREWEGKREENTEILVNKISGMPSSLDLKIQEWIPEEERGEDAPEDSLCRDAGWRDPGGRWKCSILC